MAPSRAPTPRSRRHGNDLIYRGTLSGNQIFDTTAFGIPGLVKDIGLSFGVDVNTKDTTFDPEKRAGFDVVILPHRTDGIERPLPDLNAIRDDPA